MVHVANNAMYQGTVDGMLGAGDIVPVTGMSPEEGIEMATSVGVQRRCASRFQWLISLCSVFVLFVGAAPAFAAVSGSAGPIFPAEVNVGQTFPALFVLSNTSGSPCGGPFPSGDPDCSVDINVDSNGIFITPSCASGTGRCDAGSEDPGVFQIIGNGTGGPNSSCPGITFTPGVPNAVTGEVQLTPSAQVHLGPADDSGGIANPSFCVINLTVQTVKLPTKDAIPGAPLQTRQLGLITQLISTAPPNNTGSGTGSDTTIVDGPGLQVVKTPDNGTINAGDTATFTIVVSNTGRARPPASRSTMRCRDR